MDGIRQRRHAADPDGSVDVSEVVKEDVTALLPQKTSFGDVNLSSESSELSAEKDKYKQSSVSPKDRKSVGELGDKGRKQLDELYGEETLWDIGLEVFLPFIVAGVGMATTGMTLHRVKVSTFTIVVSCPVIRNDFPVVVSHDRV